jgi:hypothetical protein
MERPIEHRNRSSIVLLIVFSLFCHACLIFDIMCVMNSLDGMPASWVVLFDLNFVSYDMGFYRTFITNALGGIPLLYLALASRHVKKKALRMFALPCIVFSVTHPQLAFDSL